MQKLAGKFLEVMKECSHIAKTGANDFHGYKYATSADVLGQVNAALVKYGIASVATPELLSIIDVTTTKGNVEHLATVKMDITLLDKESGEIFNISGLGSGQDSGDKAVMKAQTAAIKYAYMLSLAISTGDDPEADSKIDKNPISVITPSKIKEMHQNNIFECSCCGTQISEKVMRFSEKKFGTPLCMNCQKNHSVSA